jgi:hypothetical protein
MFIALQQSQFYLQNNLCQEEFGASQYAAAALT